MSILACLIGILTLLISVAMLVQEMDREEQTQEEQDRALENRDLKRKTAELTSTIKKIDEKIKRERQTVAELAELKDRQIVLRMKLEEIARAMDRESGDLERQKIVENLKLEIAALESARPPLQARLAGLRKQLQERQEAKPEESVVVRPGGSGARRAKNIFFVECNSTGIVLLKENEEPRTIITDAIGTNEDYNAFLDQVKKTRDSMVLFLLRKAGNDSYRWAAGWAQSKYEVNTGKLPIPNDGKIDLSLFRN